jgi:predicted Zn-dependent protease with MMP-like domain/Flp pilus assembly protein TadD
MGRLRTHTLIALASLPAFGCGLGLGLLLPARPAPAPETAVRSAGDESEVRAMNHPPAASGAGAEPGAPVDEAQVPFADCPLPHGDAGDPDRLLDVAADRYDAGSYAESFACASMAAELVPDAVESHHIRALAAAALGRFEVARSAYALALALDPDDPETLAAAADFYVNVLLPKSREATLLGLQYAHRGRSRVVARRRHQRPMRARLALLEAQAFNDLGIGDEAMERIEETLSLMPNLVEARYERAVSLFNLCRFEDAQAAFEDVLRVTPDDPYVHHHLGLVHEWLGREQDAQRHFARARALAPAEFHEPVLLAPAEFRAEVDRALAELPAELVALLHSVSVEVSDVPALDDLLAVDPPFSPTILGLYRGLPLGVDQAGTGSEPAPPRAVVLYRKNLARAVETRAELDAQIRRTLLHEIGHLQGMDEGDLRLRGLD